MSDIEADKICRCGFVDNNTGQSHPCHYANYTCKKPATRRFFGANQASLAGMQMKLSAYETWSCDDCWEKAKQIVNSTL